jgi:hypothetical protein
MAKQNKNVDLGNLAFMIKEIIRQMEQLDENEIETLEILLDDELMKAIEEVEMNPEPITYEEFFKNALSDHDRQKSRKAASKVA